MSDGDFLCVPDLRPEAVVDPPHNEMGEPCPWPYDPMVIVANGPVPLGMYHCPYCGTMVIAGLPHPDYREAA
jgi:hypothetical protein